MTHQSNIQKQGKLSRKYAFLVILVKYLTKTAIR